MFDRRGTTRRPAGRPGRSRSLGDRAGQALAEFTMVLPVLILLVFGIIEFGLAFRTHQIVTNSAREGARTAVIPSTDSEATRAAVRSRLDNSGLNSEEADIILRCTNPDTGETTADEENEICETTGHETEVEVGYCHRFFVLAPVIAIAGSDHCDGFGEVDLRTRSTMRTE